MGAKKYDAYFFDIRLVCGL